ncbi:Mov34/MPN/PAD-1 family protein [Hyphomonas jannaschiana]|uniref:Mov34/MPN/PAD-1 family protein n=1 Tax=Hyphomonas jannaschiana TaxID=86 RepID=UPI00138E314B|nr:Mov34/MPN/PAD-1 family protein [Hyphomonas jannaschiana]
MTESRVLVQRAILERIEQERRTAHPLETGGFLEGYRRGRDIEITGLTVASSHDRASPVSFERCSLHHQQHLLASWRRSSGLISLVGDWHSHPAGQGAPSWTDRRAWARLIRSMHGDGVALIATAQGVRIFFLTALVKHKMASELLPIEETEHDCVFARS